MVVDENLNGYKAYGLMDTGSSASFNNEDTIPKLKVPVLACKGEKVSMASTSLRLSVKDQCIITLCLQGNEYKDITVSILPDLCSDIIGHDILKRNSSLQEIIGGEEGPLDICSVAAANIEPDQLFTHLSPNCKPISIKSHSHAASDLQLIDSEIQNLLKEGIVEKSVSPWHSQVMVVTSENHRCRMAVDYSQTINRYTELDAFPLPRIDYIVNKVASYKIYSRIDLRSAYYQVPIREEDNPYTAFEASGKHYQFTHVIVGIRNGVWHFNE
ncbi:hypothetical protein PR048_033098 [Dryococelus australis]|uniref:Reverse transcriptase domain-containing protein n=1 Tax=Dryococelus australis TaxID=614101 RepID=A0ABQ9G089_9NEOP|nr:hypothetical protein PR048_033098 [Dryococelus australis]